MHTEKVQGSSGLNSSFSSSHCIPQHTSTFWVTSVLNKIQQPRLLLNLKLLAAQTPKGLSLRLAAEHGNPNSIPASPGTTYQSTHQKPISPSVQPPNIHIFLKTKKQPATCSETKHLLIVCLKQFRFRSWQSWHTSRTRLYRAIRPLPLAESHTFGLEKRSFFFGSEKVLLPSKP